MCTYEELHSVFIGSQKLFQMHNFGIKTSCIHAYIQQRSRSTVFKHWPIFLKTARCEDVIYKAVHCSLWNVRQAYKLVFILLFVFFGRQANATPWGLFISLSIFINLSSFIIIIFITLWKLTLQIYMYGQRVCSYMKSQNQMRQPKFKEAWPFLQFPDFQLFE